MNIVISIYAHPESYPPTINAITLLSEKVNKITVVGRNIAKGGWKFSENVYLRFPSKYIDSRNFVKKNLIYKIYYYLKFSLLLIRSIYINKPEIVLAYDNIGLMPVILLKPIFKYKIWYHNHDITVPENIKKFTIQWFAYKVEQSKFNKINYFSLPANERRNYFPYENFNGKYYFLPNYPLKKIYNKFYTKKNIQSEVNIIFQGSIDKGHCIEEVINLLKEENNNYRLILKGWIPSLYESKINALKEKYDLMKKVELLGETSYLKLIEITIQAHIGLAIYIPNSIMVKTIATASNKIYEYAALGLPVILFDTPYFREFFGKREWAFFSDGSLESLKKCIVEIIANYKEISESAHLDFINELNFENYFIPIMNQIID